MKLKVSNIIMTGKLPIKNKLDYKNIITTSRYEWFIRNEDNCPILSTRFEKKDGLNVQNKKKSIYITIWTTGSINLCGLKSFKEGYKYYNLILNEIRKIKSRDRRGATPLKEEETKNE